MSEKASRTSIRVQVGLFTCILLIGAVALFLLWPIYAVRIAYLDQSCHWRASEFALQWRHSVEHQLWRDVYRLDHDRLLLIRSEMQAFGAGAPSDGAPVPASPGYIGMAAHQTWPEIHWVVSRNMEGTLMTEDLVWPIHAEVPDYTEITITVDHVPQFRALWGARCNDYFHFAKPVRPT